MQSFAPVPPLALARCLVDLNSLYFIPRFNNNDKALLVYLRKLNFNSFIQDESGAAIPFVAL